MKSIPLTNSSKVTVVDDRDFRKASRHKWCLRGDGRNNRYVVSTDRPHIRLHHLINGKPPEGMETDHKDGDELNNCKSNLRKATCGQNRMNKGRYSTNTSGFKGVSWDSSCKKWRVQLQTNGKRKHLGLFSDPVKAARAYDKAAREYHREFARTNFPMRFSRL